MIHKNCILRILYNRRKANQLKPDNHGSLVICSQRWLGGVDWRLMAVAIGCVYCWSGSIQSASVSATTDFLPLSLDLSMPGWTNSISRPNNHNPDTRLPSSSWTSLTRAHTLAFLCFRKRFSSTGSLKLFKIDQKITQFLLNCFFFSFAAYLLIKFSGLTSCWWWPLTCALLSSGYFQLLLFLSLLAFAAVASTSRKHTTEKKKHGDLNERKARKKLKLCTKEMQPGRDNTN